MDPNLFAVEWERLAEVLMAIVVLSFMLERAYRLRRIATLFLVLALSPAFANAQNVERVLPSDRVTTFVKVRSQPSSDSSVTGQLEIGASAELIRSVPLWYEVRLPDGTTGFVSKAWTTVSHALQPRQEDELRIHYLNIGAGTCTVVQCPGPNAPPMIVDCGSLEPASDDMDVDETRSYIGALLGESTARPNLVISHADSDHYGYIPRVLDGSRLANIWQGGSCSSRRGGSPRPARTSNS